MVAVKVFKLYHKKTLAKASEYLNTITGSTFFLHLKLFASCLGKL